MATFGQELMHLKPAVVRALREGMDSVDNETGLRAAELWFRATGYRFGIVQPRASATELAQRLYAAAIGLAEPAGST